MFSQFVAMRMSLLPPNMNESLAGHSFLKSQIVILTLQMLNSFLVKYRTVKENHNNESLSSSFFLMLPGFSAWIVLVIVFLFLFFLQSSRSVFIFYFSLILPSIQVAFFLSKVSILFSSVNLLPSFLFSLLPLFPSSKESFSP